LLFILIVLTHEVFPSDKAVYGIYFVYGGIFMENKVAMIGIIIENTEYAEKVNNILHMYNKFIIGRLGIPYHKRNISIISVVIDASNDIISSVSGKLGMLPDVYTKVIYYKSSNH